MKRFLTVVSFLAFALILILSFQNCGAQFSARLVDSTSDANGDPLFQVAPKVIVYGETHVPRGKCVGPFEIESSQTSTSQVRVTLPSALEGKIFADSACTLAVDPQAYAVAGSSSIYLKSEVLMQTQLPQNFVTPDGSPVTIAFYKAQLMDTAYYSESRVFFARSDSHKSHVLGLNSFPTFTPSVGAPEQALVDNPLLGAQRFESGGVVRTIAFNKTHVYLNRVGFAARALAVAGAVMNSDLGCYTTGSEVLCSSDFTGIGPIDLPKGDVTDLIALGTGVGGSERRAVCALVNSQAYCWTRDFIVKPMSLGNDLKMLAGFGYSKVCGLRKTGSLACVSFRTSLDAQTPAATSTHTDIVNIWGGTINNESIIVQRSNGAISVFSGDANVGAAEFDVSNAFGEMDEMGMTAGNVNATPLGCGRKGRAVYCFARRVRTNGVSTIVLNPALTKVGDI